MRYTGIFILYFFYNIFVSKVRGRVAPQPAPGPQDRGPEVEPRAAPGAGLHAQAVRQPHMQGINKRGINKGLNEIYKQG